MSHRGNVGLIIIIVLGALLAALVLNRLSAPQQENNKDDIRPTSEELQKVLTDEGFSEKEAQYNVGIQYSLTALALAADDIYGKYGSYERLCVGGKINRADPDVLKGLTDVVCGPNSCDYVPYILRDEANDRCYASQNAYTVSGDLAGFDNTFTLCIDLAHLPDGIGGMPNKNTLRCDVVR